MLPAHWNKRKDTRTLELIRDLRPRAWLQPSGARGKTPLSCLGTALGSLMMVKTSLDPALALVTR